jgi:hypothetical protein
MEPQAVDTKIRFQPNVPETFALRFAKGKPTKSSYNGEDQVLFSTMDGRQFYVSPYAAAKIEAAGAQPGEDLMVCKRTVRQGNKMGYEWEARLLGEQQEPVETVVAPTVKAPPAPTAAANNSPNPIKAVTQLEHALKTTLAACKAAEEFAASIGYRREFGPEEIQRMAVSVLIGMQQQQQGGRQ